MAIKVSPSTYRKGQIAISFGRGLVRHVSEKEAEALGNDLINAATDAQIDRVNRHLSEQHLRAEKAKHDRRFGRRKK